MIETIPDPNGSQWVIYCIKSESTRSTIDDIIHNYQSPSWGPLWFQTIAAILEQRKKIWLIYIPNGREEYRKVQFLMALKALKHKKPRRTFNLLWYTGWVNGQWGITHRWAEVQNFDSIEYIWAYIVEDINSANISTKLWKKSIEQIGEILENFR